MNLKKRMVGLVDQHTDDLFELACRIHANPELGFEEHKASAWMADYLSRFGFGVEKGYSGLETAVNAVYGQGRPVLAILAEYDALPEIGHGCGHNLIAAAAAGAGLAARLAVDEFGGTLRIIGTPAEELGGGKAKLVEAGAFNDLEAVLMVHPQVRDIATLTTQALETLTVDYYGREAHAAVMPSAGINALDALILAFNSINALRQRLINQGAVAGIITDGGKAANVVPAHSRAEFVIRASGEKELEALKEEVLGCFRGAAEAIGARLEYRWNVRLGAMRTSHVLGRILADNMAYLGRPMQLEEYRSLGSTDIGNVSQIVPTVQGLVAIAPQEVRMHTSELADAAVSESGRKGMMDGAKAMALSVADLLAEPENLRRARAEFKAS